MQGKVWLGEGCWCKHLQVPAQAVWEVLWSHPHSYERWKSSKEISLFQAAELTGPLQGLKLCCCL